MTTIAQISLKSPHINQRRILLDKARFRVVACGRRFGKTELAKIACAHRLVKGQGIWYASPTYKNSKRVWRSLKATFSQFPGVYMNNTDMRLELPTGGWLECVSTHEPDNLRGAGLDFVVMDEAAFMSPTVWSGIIRPMLLESQGGALFPSSPNGRNWFYDLYSRGRDPEEAAWSSHHYSSMDNPLINPAEFDEILRSTPERTYKEEYLAEFLSDSGRVFRNVREAATVEPGQEPISGNRYIFGVDWGKENDYTVIAVVDATRREMVALDRFNQIGWNLQRGRLKALADAWQPAAIYAEQNSIGSVNIEELQRDGLPVHGFQTTAQSKPPLIEALSLAIERGDIALLNDPVLIHELISYELERMASGRYRYDAPPGQHDDTVIATALAWHGTSQPSIVLW